MKTRSGFTLIELSIVLVIIGLIIGGILVGRDLIHAAEVRKTISQVEQTKTAFATFKSKYNCLPGDCANASEFFTGAINGDGNGQIDCNEMSNTDLCLEPYNAWSHLSAAGLITGSFSPFTTTIYDNNADIQNGGNFYAIPPIGPQMFAPSAALSGSFLTVFYYWPDNAASVLPALTPRNYLVLSEIPYGDVFADGAGTTANDLTAFIEFMGLVPGYSGPMGLYPRDGLAIDTKTDDGLPLTGKVSVFSAPGPSNIGCIPPDGSNIYDMSDAGNVGACAMYIPLGM